MSMVTGTPDSTWAVKRAFVSAEVVVMFNPEIMYAFALAGYRTSISFKEDKTVQLTNLGNTKK